MCHISRIAALRVGFAMLAVLLSPERAAAQTASCITANWARHRVVNIEDGDNRIGRGARGYVADVKLGEVGVGTR